jgi:hypothetical protein
LDEASITRYITDTFDGVDVVVASREAGSPEIAWGDTFFSYDPIGTWSQNTGSRSPRSSPKTMAILTAPPS